MKLGSSCLAVLIALFISCAQVHADPAGISLGIHFAADEPPGVGSPVGLGGAGVLRTENWNNVNGASGSASNLIVDAFGGGAPVPTSVTWSSPNTWSSAQRGEENNSAPPGNDRNLMLGYIDTGNSATTGATVTVSGLIPEITDLGYDVYVYMQGGVNGRFGDYTIGGVTKTNTQSGPFTGTYIEGATGNYLLFNDVNMPGGFTLTALAGAPNFAGFRAPINGIEIVANLIPEPSSLVMAALGAAGLLGLRVWRRRKRPAS